MRIVRGAGPLSAYLPKKAAMINERLHVDRVPAFAIHVLPLSGSWRRYNVNMRAVKRLYYIWKAAVSAEVALYCCC